MDPEQSNETEYTVVELVALDYVKKSDDLDGLETR